MVEELLKQRSTFKALVIKSEMTLNCLIKERDFNLIHKHGVMMKYWFHSFDEASESYIETLSNETDITDAESYYDAVYDNYMDQLDSLNYTMDNFTVQAPVVVQRADTHTSLSTISQTTKLPTMDLEPADSTHSKHPEQEVVKSPTEQVQTVMNKELVHLSTCTRDHTAPNCDQSLLDLHIDVKAQSEVSIATITIEQQPDLFDCEPPVTMQCSPISLDPHIDQTDLHVQSPLSCAHYSHTAHATMHPDRDVLSRGLFRPANSRYTDHHVLNAPLQHQLELKECYIHSQTPRPGRKVKDGTLHITSTPRPAACLYLSGIT